MLHSSAVLPILETFMSADLHRFLGSGNETHRCIVFFHKMDDTNVIVERDLIRLGKLSQRGQVSGTRAKRPQDVLRQVEFPQLERNLNE